jgi:hypothetical protein
MTHFDTGGRAVETGYRRIPLSGFQPELGHDAMRTLNRLGVDHFEITRQLEPPDDAVCGETLIRFPRPRQVFTYVRIGPFELDGDEALIVAAIIFSNPRDRGERK